MDRRAWILLWSLALLWGGSYMFIEVALDGGLHPVFIVFMRLALAALVLIPLAHRAGALRTLRPLWRPVLLLAVVQVVAPFLLITFGQEHVASGLTGVLVASAPIFTALLGMAGYGVERTSGWNLAGVLTGIVGVVILFGADLTGSSDLVLGGAMIVLAALGYAVGAIYLRNRMAGVEPIAVAAATMSTSAVLVAPVAAVFLPAAVPPAEAFGAIAVLGLLGTGVAFAIFYRLITEYGAHKASIVAYLAPGFALFYGTTLLGEPLTLGGIAGLALILAGSYTAAQGRPPWRTRARGPAAAAPA